MSEAGSERKIFSLDRITATLMCISMLGILIFDGHMYWDVTHGNPEHWTLADLGEQLIATAGLGFAFTLQHWSYLTRPK